jgi:hypothetical protein
MLHAVRRERGKRWTEKEREREKIERERKRKRERERNRVKDKKWKFLDERWMDMGKESF